MGVKKGLFLSFTFSSYYLSTDQYVGLAEAFRKEKKFRRKITSYKDKVRSLHHIFIRGTTEQKKPYN